jgi:hypothetical protein
MNRSIPRAWFFGLALFLAGCQSREPEGFARFTPDPEAARKAVATALYAWRAGASTSPIEGVSPKLMLIDARQKAGRKLGTFEVLGEVPSDNGRGIAAKLTFEGEGPDEPPIARYSIVGIDPLYIFRQEDLDMFCHWMHDMEQSSTPASAKESP